MTKKKSVPVDNLISVAEFAKRKGVKVPSVHYHIKTSFKISATQIGKYYYIDWNKYQDFVFENAERFKTEESPVTQTEII